ncbi:MAG: hypothetical protein ACPGJS_16705 [Flammeovirgaceae bacterium]
MPKIRLFILLAFTLSYTTSLAQSYANKRFLNDKSKRDFLRFLADKYTQNGIAILDAEDDYKNYTVYARGPSHQQMLESFGTVIHESCHGYNFQIGISKMKAVNYANNYQGYYISPTIKIAAPEYTVYRSTELNKVVPKAWQKKIFRYDTYVGDGSEVSSQVNGIYGMIDEFDAYYQGTKANLELQNYYETFCDYSDTECWADYLSESSSSLYAYYEFRLFIAWYLKYAKQKYPKVYKETMSNQTLRVAFTLINNLYADLQNEYFARRAEIIKKLNTHSNKRVTVENGFLMIYDKDGMGASGKGAPDNIIKELKSYFTSEDLAILKQFRIDGITIENYKQFLN